MSLYYLIGCLIGLFIGLAINIKHKSMKEKDLTIGSSYAYLSIKGDKHWVLIDQIDNKIVKFRLWDEEKRDVYGKQHELKVIYFLKLFRPLTMKDWGH